MAQFMSWFRKEKENLDSFKDYETVDETVLLSYRKLRRRVRRSIFDHQTVDDRDPKRDGWRDGASPFDESVILSFEFRSQLTLQPGCNNFYLAAGAGAFTYKGKE